MWYIISVRVYTQERENKESQIVLFKRDIAILQYNILLLCIRLCLLSTVDLMNRRKQVFL